MNIARVFPRRTRATPDDALTFTGPPPREGLPDVQEVHISVAFTYDLDRAHQLAEAWARTGLPVRMGGPAFHEPGGDFIPGRYLKHGYVITSRGLPQSLLVLRGSQTGGWRPAGAAHHRGLECAGRQPIGLL